MPVRVIFSWNVFLPWILSLPYLFESADHVEREDDGAKVDESVQCCAHDDEQKGRPVLLDEQDVVEFVT